MPDHPSLSKSSPTGMMVCPGVGPVLPSFLHLSLFDQVVLNILIQSGRLPSSSTTVYHGLSKRGELGS